LTCTTQVGFHLALRTRESYTDLLPDIGPELDTELSEEYFAEHPPDDGVVYSKIRMYQGFQGIADPFLEQRWLAVLGYYSKRKRDNLKKIIDDPDYRAAFDIQLYIPGLSHGMELGVIHKISTMRFDDVGLPPYFSNRR